MQKELDAKQKLELEIEKLKGQMEVRRHMGGGDDEPSEQEKMERLKEELQDKIDDLEVIESLNKGLLERESKAKDEVQEARKELIQVSYPSFFFRKKKCLSSEKCKGEVPQV